jgi:hypothetical protein
MGPDPLPDFAWKLTLNGQEAAMLASVAVPTETSIEFGIGLVVGETISDLAFQEMQGQRRTMSGNLITLDTSLRATHCDAWDSSFIQEVEISPLDASQSRLMTLSLTLQVTNLREVPIPTPGAAPAAPFGRANWKSSQLMQRLGRRVRNNPAPAPSHRRDPLPAFCFKIALSGSSAQLYVKNLGPLTYSSGVIAPIVINMGEAVATDFRAWKQAGGLRDLTIQCLDTALRLVLTIVCRGCTVMQIVPAVPISAVGPVSVMLNVSSFTISY